METHTRQKLCQPFSPPAKAKLFCQKSFVPATRVGVFIWKIFIQVTEISAAKTEISVIRPTGPLIWTHRNLYEGNEARSRKRSNPGWPGSYGEAIRDQRRTETRLTLEEIVPDSWWNRNVLVPDWFLPFTHRRTNPKEKHPGLVTSPEILNPKSKVGTLNPKTFASGKFCRVNASLSNPDIFPQAILWVCDITKMADAAIQSTPKS